MAKREAVCKVSASLASAITRVGRASAKKSAPTSELAPSTITNVAWNPALAMSARPEMLLRIHELLIREGAKEL